MSDTPQIRDRDGSLTDVPESREPQCSCDGSGWAGVVIIDGRDVAQACPVCKPHLAGVVPTVAQRHARAVPRRRRLALVR